VWNRTTFKSLVVPGGVLLLSVAVLTQTGWLTLAPSALSFLYYCGLIGGMLLAWRFHSSRIFLALLVLFLGQQAIASYGVGHAAPGPPVWAAMTVTAALVPLNFVLIALMHERGVAISSLAPFGLFLFVQAVFVAVLGNSEAVSSPASRLHHAAATFSLPVYILLSFAVSGIFLLARCILTRKPSDSALLWSLAAFFLSLHFNGSARFSMAYSATAAFILASSIIETSYLLAYHDELTTLPSRRAFNDAMLRLEDPYTIAAVDIDHFKKFNDTYGHDTGDQVLRLVASKLARVTGGGQAYRYGGEEFAIIFPGKTIGEVFDHLEQLREVIENTGFRMRGNDRRQIPRGPDRRDDRRDARGNDRRNQRAHGRVRKGDAIRRLAREQSPTPSVTVSIGVAGSWPEKAVPDLVLEEADKALYRAKGRGRNRVEVSQSARQRKDRRKAAGIA
jgi:diguanylate cyclase (GGDEF)-like protein